MKVEKMEYHGPRAKRCQDKRLTFLLDSLDKYIRAGVSPQVAWLEALSDYSKEFHNRSK